MFNVLNLLHLILALLSLFCLACLNLSFVLKYHFQGFHFRWSCDTIVVLSKVTNTMTDRCVTNDCVDRKLEEVLSQKLNSFRCSMHPLDSFYHACEKAVKAYENKANKPENTQQMPFKKGNESDIRAIDKLFNNLGSGCGQELRTYIFTPLDTSILVRSTNLNCISV